jgi:dinuclear metal center YbgI/SA1388 family protein
MKGPALENKKMKIKEITDYLELWAPLNLQESYDNSGLIAGNAETELTGALITLDCTEEVVMEAIDKKMNLIIAHHPVVFKPIRSITGKTYVERVLMLAIKNDIALYAIHTNLDNIREGVNSKIAHKLGLQHTRILEPKKGYLKKLVTFVPSGSLQPVCKALHEAGAGNIGNYSECSFVSKGTGRFKPNEQANPAVGINGKLEEVHENRLEVIFPSSVENELVKALILSHPYETPAFDLIPLDNRFTDTGGGMLGHLPYRMKEAEFLLYLKEMMKVSFIRHSPFSGKDIERVALCGGSGSFLLNAAKREKADVFISSDFKYHEFFDAENMILIADINHYEGEVFTKDLIYEHLIEKFSNIALVLSDIKTNPIRYL